MTCTVRAQPATTATTLFLSSVEASERYTKFADMADTFLHWAVKVQRIIDEMEATAGKLSAPGLTRQLGDRGLRCRGTPVTKAMILSVGHAHDLFDESSRAVLRKIEMEFGRDVLSTNYTKLSRFMALVRTHAASVAAPGKVRGVPSWPKA